MGELRDDSFGGRLIKRREQLGLTLEEVGKAIGKSKQHVANWEKGRASWPTVPVFFKLADALSLNPRILAFGHEGRLTAPVLGFPGTETGVQRLKMRRRSGP